MGVLDYAALLGIVLLVVGIAYWATRWAAHGYERQNAHTREIDAELRILADRCGVSFREGGEYSHPILGAIEQFGGLSGHFGPCIVRVAIESEAIGPGGDGPLAFFAVAYLTAPEGAQWTPERVEFPRRRRGIGAPGALLRTATVGFADPARRSNAERALAELVAISSSVELDGWRARVELRAARPRASRSMLYESYIESLEGLDAWLVRMQAVCRAWFGPP